MNMVQSCFLAVYLLLFLVKLYGLTQQKHQYLALLITPHKLIFAVFLIISIGMVIGFKPVVRQYHLANMVLFYVMFSSAIKLCKPNILLNERKAGLFIQAVAGFFIAILLLFQPGGVIIF